jgi:[ribosomal protein S18]-alanine N-acetyltransferase
MIFNFCPLDETYARAILAWNYEQPYDFYNASPFSIEEDLKTLLNPYNYYYAIAYSSREVSYGYHSEDKYCCVPDRGHLNEQNYLIAFNCFGEDARVPGGDYTVDALDVGAGLRPDLTGQGLGLKLISAGLDFANSMFAPSAFRVTVAAFNQRALRVWQKAGFYKIQSFNSDSNGREFVILMRESPILVSEKIQYL